MCLRRLSTPCFVPSAQPLELFFFQQVFNTLCQQSKNRDEANRILPELDAAEEQEVALVDFQRAMVRLFKIIHDDRKFDAMEYDANKNGNVGWYEFCSVWKERQIIVRLSMAERVFLTFEDAQRSMAGMFVSFLVLVCIVLSTMSYILSTVPELQDGCRLASWPDYDPSCRPRPKEFFKVIDLVCTIFFTTEYAIRIVTSAFVRTELIDRDRQQLLEWMTSDDIITVPTHLSRVRAWALHLSNLIDLLSIIPGYMNLGLSDGDHSPALNLIRLMRVIRAFRLGRRLEAVVIIVRSLQTSIRALGVLMLNLLLGVVIFSSLMYFAEEGTWDSSSQAFLRWEGLQWNNMTQSWEPMYGRSPFESIPACFWWAIVTATTVGYGDAHTPRTAAGKVVTGIFMVWSLCVLALPIGVIGGNFSQVYQEYDQEKQSEEERRVLEEAMLKRSMAFGDPLHYSKQLLIEVWHDSGIGSGKHGVIQSEFLGEVEYTLNLNTKDTVRQTVRESLSSNFDKAKRKVRGHVVFEYVWRPDPIGPDQLLAGSLEVTVLKAENLLKLDWKRHGKVDPYCVVTVHPQSADKDGVVPEINQRSKTLFNTMNPEWNATSHFQFRWMKEAGDATAELVYTNRKRTRSSGSTVSSVGEPPESPNSRHSALRRKDLDVDLVEEDGEWCTGRSSVVGSEAGVSSRRLSLVAPQPDTRTAKTEKLLQRRPEAKAELLRALVPELQGEVDKLKAFVPKIQREVSEVREDLQLILEALKRRSPAAADSWEQPWEDRQISWS